ncbi:PGPGW domain-containing protein [Oryzobacter terrae]|uniref:PGPGW domain-containing protein n=1 Tax=Oryzobacter terrae TaxID=1620385 RepID=UPI003671E110
MSERTSPNPVLRDPSDDDKDWEWRRRIRANPHSLRVWRGLVFTAGLVLVVGGLALVPLPGPGWLIVILGIAVWASEFELAARLLTFVKEKVRAWESWAKVQPWWVKGLLGLGCALVVGGAVWLVLRFSGVPGFVPESVTGWLHVNAGL